MSQSRSSALGRRGDRHVKGTRAAQARTQREERDQVAPRPPHGSATSATPDQDGSPRAALPMPSPARGPFSGRASQNLCVPGDGAIGASGEQADPASCEGSHRIALSWRAAGWAGRQESPAGVSPDLRSRRPQRPPATPERTAASH